MSNMQPQAPKLNQKTWKYLEDYTRELVSKDNEAYIYAGCYGDKGRLCGKVTVPTSCFKIIVVLPVGDDDLMRVNAATRVIAVDMPNDESVSIRWRSYLTTAREIQRKTGFDFLANVPQQVQKEIESKNDEQSIERQNADATTSISESDSGSNDGNSSNRQYFLGSRSGCYYLTASGTKKYDDKKFCESMKEPEAKSENSEQNKTNQTESKDKNEQKSSPEKKTLGDGRTYLKGSRGGCYYLNNSGKKIYVDKDKCDQ